ncbi:hypothetical protein [Myxococcus fulvus]|uniref:hypothetical protein n=1 Tax=Myxococcus TaxID=32 RepID=UPI0020C14BAA|nr:hypothetical protein [Myxococcus fulvus]MCK8502365.1 hypothetical protein [Myxococcus fulvus]
MTMTRRWLAVCAGLAAVVCASGCASSPQKALLGRTSGLVVYDLPAMQVMKAAEAELGERGYALLPSTDPYFLQTPWKVSGNYDMGSSWSRLYVEGRVRADGRFVVRAYEMAATTFARTQALPFGLRETTSATIDDKPNATPAELIASEPELQTRSARANIRRNLDLEWAILERLNPDFANKVKEQVDLYVAHEPR